MPKAIPLTALLVDPGSVREISPDLYSALPNGMGPASYDRKAAAYDAVVGRSLYHRIFWGTSAAAYSRFGRKALDAAGGGHFTEIGCGSLLFTAAMYRDARSTSAVLVDRSLALGKHVDDLRTAAAPKRLRHRRQRIEQRRLGLPGCHIVKLSLE